MAKKRPKKNNKNLNNNCNNKNGEDIKKIKNQSLDFKPLDPDAPVELHHGFFWICDSCGHENFVRASVPELTKDDIEFIKLSQNLQNVEGQTLFYSPTEVTCKKCEKTFKSEYQQIG